MFHPSLRTALATLDRPATPAEWLRLVEGLHTSPGFWWLDTALPDGRLGRYSFAGADPYLLLRAWGHDVEVDVRREVRSGLPGGIHRFAADPIECARSLLPRADSLLHSIRTTSRSGDAFWHPAAGVSPALDLPFVGGAVGYLGYELAATLEPGLRFDNDDDLGLPDLAFAFVDQLLCYDHGAERLFAVGLGFADRRSSVDRRPGAVATSRARERADALAADLERILSASRGGAAGSTETARPAATGSGRAGETAGELASTTDASGYAKAVDTVLGEIEAGNVYQANFSQRLSADAPVDPWRLYLALRRHNPAPFAAYLTLPDGVVLSSSPERFLRMDSTRRVESRPIKGTRPRGDDAFEDARLEAELAASAKDRAENLMIVDLVRNDLGRVCAPGTIGVPELMAIERYAAVFQMVSTVEGRLAAGRDGFDLIAATFPPGSMTGAPKLAAIGLLERLERVRRGVYAGALGHLDVRGGLDLSVVIRTIVWKAGRAHLHVGGGVVADSSPEGEYLESLDKAKAPLAALAEVLGGRST
jgi:aminodeoxychorismate synthase component I